MISAIDTNILLDIFLPNPAFAEKSKKVLKQAYDEGAIVICDIVYAELVPQFKDRKKLDNALQIINVIVSSIDADVAYLAGERWQSYRESQGTRTRIITDFLIGAHAALKTDRFLTRDRGFYGSCFSQLVILDPSAEASREGRPKQA